MSAVSIGPLAYLLRLVEGLPVTAENRLGLHEIKQGLNNILNQIEKSDDDDD